MAEHFPERFHALAQGMTANYGNDAAALLYALYGAWKNGFDENQEWDSKRGAAAARYTFDEVARRLREMEADYANKHPYSALFAKAQGALFPAKAGAKITIDVLKRLVKLLQR